MKLDAYIWVYYFGNIFINSTKISFDTEKSQLIDLEYNSQIAHKLLVKKVKGKITFLISINESKKREIVYFLKEQINEIDIGNLKTLLDSEIQRILKRF
jgi:hypothetical protein